MPSVDVTLGERSYRVVIAPDALDDAAAWRSLAGPRTLLVVTNEVVAPLYLERLCAALDGAKVHTLVLPDGEHVKTADNWMCIIDRLVEIKAARDVCLVALGGGVIGDLCGFAAATYMRGVDFIQVPTTLLAQVDAAVGGKTAINHPGGKNLVGAFHQPLAVVADTRTLQTLPGRHFRAGLAEVVKYGAIQDAEFLRWLEDHADAILGQDPECLEHLIETCVRHKAAVVGADERESGQRALLNFGHSFGHALEVLSGYREYLHGEAVSIGMAIAARLSEQRGLCPRGHARRITALLSAFGLPLTLPGHIGTREMLEAMALDKKNQGGQARLILLAEIGRAIIDTRSTDEELSAAIDACRT